MSLILGLISGSNRRTMFSPGWWRVDRLLHLLQVYSAQIYWFTKFVFSRYWLHRSFSKSISKMFAFPIIASFRHHLQISFPRKVFLEKFLKAPLWLLPISCTASNCLSSSTRRLLSHLDPHLWTGLEITRWKPLMFFRLWNFRHRFERAPFTGKNSAVPDLESVPRFRKHLYNQFLNCFLRLASLSELEIRNLKLRVRRNFDFFFGSKHSSFTIRNSYRRFSSWCSNCSILSLLFIFFLLVELLAMRNPRPYRSTHHRNRQEIWFVAVRCTISKFKVWATGIE